MLTNNNSSIIQNVLEAGSNTSFRNFKTLDDLLIYINKFQKDHEFDLRDPFGSAYGIMTQFMGFDLPIKDRKKEEMLIYFLEEDPRTIHETIKVNTLWINNKTRKVLDKPPDWYNESKKKEILSSWN